MIRLVISDANTEKYTTVFPDNEYDAAHQMAKDISDIVGCAVVFINCNTDIAEEGDFDGMY